MTLLMMNESIVHAIESRNKVFLEGPYGSGKTTLGIHRIEWLLSQEQVRGSDILALVPQRALGRPYSSWLRSAGAPSGSPVQVTTVASLARRSAELYWPLIAEAAGYKHPSSEPVFLNLETSQYHMGPIVDDALQNGGFEGVRVERSRVISQVLDNLNKAALNGYSIDKAYARLEGSVVPGEHRTAYLNALRTAKAVSVQFREVCLEKNYVDYSLQIELLNRQILTAEWSRTHLTRAYRHLIFDSVEEDTYTAHSLVRRLMPGLDSALLISDSDGGLRAFLGASPEGAERLRGECDKVIVLNSSHVMESQIWSLERAASQLFRSGRSKSAGKAADPTPYASLKAGTAPALHLPEVSFRFYPQMIYWVADRVLDLVEDGVQPAEIVVIAPFMSDALKFSLQTAFQDKGVPSTTHRPSRPLHSDQAARSMLTLAAIAHPHWNMSLSATDIAGMLASTIAGADPVRASLLAKVVYRPGSSTADLSKFETLATQLQERVTYRFGEQYDRLRDWIYAYRAEPVIDPLDHFWSRLFGELLSQPGYTYHRDLDAASVVHQLVTAARNFRWAVAPTITAPLAESDTGQAFYRLVESGAVGALYAAGWEERDAAVLIAPAYTYLMRNRPVDYQFWLDVGSTGWWERLYQPLTHPYVLSHQWDAGKAWTDMDEFQARQRTMRHLILGLIRRTRKGIYLGLTQYNESGYEQQGALLTVINRLLSTDGVRSATL